jgi:hypothetical protein
MVEGILPIGTIHREHGDTVLDPDQDRGLESGRFRFDRWHSDRLHRPGLADQLTEVAATVGRNAPDTI